MYEDKYTYVFTVWIISSILDNRSLSLIYLLTIMQFHMVQIIFFFKQFFFLFIWLHQVFIASSEFFQLRKVNTQFWHVGSTSLTRN